MVVATAKDKESPGCFRETLIELQTVNKVPAFNMGNIVPPNFESLMSVYNGQSRDDGASGTRRRSSKDAYSSGTQRNRSVPETSGTQQMSPTHTGSNGTKPKNKNVATTSRQKAGRSFPKITIIKKKTSPAITSTNMEKLYNEGSILFESAEKLAPEKCLELLLGNLIECKDAISKSISRDFRSLKN